MPILRKEVKEKILTISGTPLPKFWLSETKPVCFSFKVRFNETMYYHLMLLGWCEWEIPERLLVVVTEPSNNTPFQRAQGK